ncbi:hypothetical protein N7U49_02020 [Streptomyces sp. AD2-2]|nr:hypothetical protein N7U49_02020 [Streptomyces sp. AD2-2]
MIALAQPWPASRICRAMCSSWKLSISAGVLERADVDRVQPAGGEQLGDVLAGGPVVGVEHVQRSPVRLSGDPGRGERGVERLHDPNSRSRCLGDPFGGGGSRATTNASSEASSEASMGLLMSISVFPPSRDPSMAASCSAASLVACPRS